MGKIGGAYVETGALSTIDNQIDRTGAGVFCTTIDRGMREFGRMLKLLLSISFVFSAIIGDAQKISYSYYAYVRAGFENHVGFSADFAYDSVNFEMNGEICRADSNTVIINPKKAGKSTINSKAYFKGKLIYSGSFPLDIMKPEVFGVFGTDLQKKLKLDLIKAYPGVRFVIRVNNFHWEPVGIVSYRFSIIRDRKIVYSIAETSNRFSEFVKAELEKLEVGDLILISEIIVDDFFKGQTDPMPTIYEVEL